MQVQIRLFRWSFGLDGNIGPDSVACKVGIAVNDFENVETVGPRLDQKDFGIAGKV